MDVQTEASTTAGDAGKLYAELEERVLARDQVGASKVYYNLLRAGRPLSEIVSAGVRTHAPYTHVPYHERFDDGYPNFVNNDHCLLSARATLNLARMLPGKLSHLPMAQTIWYMPTGLDIWNQKINKAPGHYTRMRGRLGQVEAPPAPVVYWPDQEPLRDTAPLHERLNNWFTLVHRGQVIDAYRTFLGIMEAKANQQGGAGRAGVLRDDRSCRIGCCGTGPIPPGTRRIARARRWRSVTRSAGTMRTTCYMPARWILASGRAGIRPTKWPATA